MLLIGRIIRIIVQACTLNWSWYKIFVFQLQLGCYESEFLEGFVEAVMNAVRGLPVELDSQSVYRKNAVTLDVVDSCLVQVSEQAGTCFVDYTVYINNCLVHVCHIKKKKGVSDNNTHFLHKGMM